MKQLLIAVLFLPPCLNAQQLPINKEGRITFTGVVQVPGISQKILRDKAVKIISDIFSLTPGTAIHETPGSLVFKGYAFYNINKVGVELPYFFNFTMHISFEEGKYSYITTDFVDDENIPLEKGLLNPAEIYNAEGQVKPSGKETFEAITTGLKNVGERFTINMNASLR